MLLEQADKAIDSVDQQVREEKQQVVQSQGNDRETLKTSNILKPQN
jgi:hypothetical protein